MGMKNYPVILEIVISIRIDEATRIVEGDSRFFFALLT